MEAQGIKTYDKEKLNEYAKELFALCLEKDLYITAIISSGSISIHGIGSTYISKSLFNSKIGDTMPIWELIEKVKSL